MSTSADEKDTASQGVAQDISEPPSLQRTLDNHQNLAQWVTQHGGFVDQRLKIRYDASKGYHGIVEDGHTIAAHTRIASCPLPVTLSVLNVLDISPFQQHGTRFPNSFLQKYQFATDILQTFFLMDQHVRGEQSFWAPYIKTLPSIEDVESLQFESEEDTAWIRGTNLEPAFAAQARKWLNQFEEANELLKDLGWESAKNGSYTYRLFRWAATIFGSRSFTSSVFEDTPAADKARPMGRRDPDHKLLEKLFSEKFAVLLPLLDILNHRPAALVEWQAKVDFVGLQVEEEYTSGKEVFNNYGPRENEGLLMSYGFVVEDNPFEHVLISINAHPGTFLEIARTWPQDDRSNDHYNCYIYDVAHPIVQQTKHLERALFSYDLLDSISVMIANDREFQAMHTRRQTLMGKCLPDRFEDFRNILATLAQIMYDSGFRARRIHSSTPEREPRTQKQRNAQIYRRRQVNLLQAAEGVCAFVLLNASTDQKPSDLLLSMQMKLPTVFSSDVEGLCNQLSCFTKKNELFSGASLIDLLPSPTANGVRSCLRSVEIAICEAVPSHLRLHEDRVKTSFTITLSALCATHRSQIELPFRLKNWMDEMTSSYPPEDPNWNYVPGPGPHAPGEEPPPGLINLLGSLSKVAEGLASASTTKTWLEPKLVCWAWNVMEEEGMRVPIEIERFISEEPAQVDGATGFMLYCRQYV